MAIDFLLLISRQGKVRLAKYYVPYSRKEKARTEREVVSKVLARPRKLCNFIEYRDRRVIYKRCVARAACALVAQAAANWLGGCVGGFAR